MPFFVTTGVNFTNNFCAFFHPNVFFLVTFCSAHKNAREKRWWNRPLMFSLCSNGDANLACCPFTTKIDHFTVGDRDRLNLKSIYISILLQILYIPIKQSEKILQSRNCGSGWEFTKLLWQICKIFCNFKVFLLSSYS